MGPRELLLALSDDSRDAKRREITIEVATDAALRLAEKVKKAAFDPEVIVGILEGGRQAATTVAAALQLPLGWLKIGRNIKIDHVYKNDPEPIRWAFSVYHHYLFRTRKPEVISSELPSVVGRRILVVDDAIDSGGSVQVALRALREKGAADIRVGCLSLVNTSARSDFSVLEVGDYKFPWSVG